MAYEMRPGQGSAFKNDKKTEDWHPAYKGKVMLPDGSTHWLDITPKKTKAGETWVAIKIGNQVSPPAMAPVTDHSHAKANAFVADADSDIPF
jgi:lambda repressor-like predicted transcriptional regulator